MFKIKLLKYIPWGRNIFWFSIKHNQRLAERQTAMAWPNMEDAMLRLLKSISDLEQAISQKALPSDVEETEVALIRSQQAETKRRIDVMLEGMLKAKKRLL
ncbi:MAG: hypothetical protein AAB899_02870 [Patescibacteria group bacterium]